MRAFAVLLLLSMGVSAEAQEAQPAQDLPIMGSQSSEDSEQAAQEQTRRILVIGDGLAGGLGAGLARVAEGQEGVEIVNRTQEASGLARPEAYDWAEYLPNILDSRSFTDVVVLIGANDRQQIRSGNFRHAFGAPEWEQAYRANTGRLLDALMARDVQVHWVALPPMGDARYDADMRQVVELQRLEVEARGARFVDLRREFLKPDGSYTDTGADDTGQVRKLRASDGVTFFKQGNNRFGQLVLAAISRDEPALQVQPALKPGLDAGPPAEPLTAPEFGLSAEDGSIATYQPEASRIAENAVQAPASPQLPLSRDDVPPGSAAEQLFTNGEAEPGPSGRYDDFSYVQPQN